MAWCPPSSSLRHDPGSAPGSPQTPAERAEARKQSSPPRHLCKVPSPGHHPHPARPAGTAVPLCLPKRGCPRATASPAGVSGRPGRGSGANAGGPSPSAFGPCSLPAGAQKGGNTESLRYKHCAGEAQARPGHPGPGTGPRSQTMAQTRGDQGSPSTAAKDTPGPRAAAGGERAAGKGSRGLGQGL